MDPPQECRGCGAGRGLQSWATKIITVLGEAHPTVQTAKAEGRTSLNPQFLAGLRAGYDAAVSVGITHNRHRD